MPHKGMARVADMHISLIVRGPPRESYFAYANATPMLRLAQVHSHTKNVNFQGPQRVHVILSGSPLTMLVAFQTLSPEPFVCIRKVLQILTGCTLQFQYSVVTVVRLSHIEWSQSYPSIL